MVMPQYNVYTYVACFVCVIEIYFRYFKKCLCDKYLTKYEEK
jgi:hypothetical protein